MKNLIIIDGQLYKLKAKDMKLLSDFTSGENSFLRGNKCIHTNTKDTDSMLIYIFENYEPIGEIKGVFNL